MKFQPIKTIKEHHTAKNKNLEAVYLTSENVKDIEQETRAFSIFNDTTLLTGFMSFQKFPVWMICINPKSKKQRRYIFESGSVFKNYFEVVE